MLGMTEITGKLTINRLRVMKALLEGNQELYQAELADRIAMNPAVLSRVLKSLEEYGWVESRDEEIDTKEAGRPARRYYRLTDWGVAQARDALQKVALKGPLDETHVNQAYSDADLLNSQGPMHDYTHTVTGLEEIRKPLCDAIWERIEFLRTNNGYEAWNRSEAAIRVRTNSPGTVELFLKLIDEVTTEHLESRPAIASSGQAN